MPAATFPVLCFADELEANPGLLPAFAEEFGAADGVSLLIYAPDRDPGDALRALGGAIERARLDEDGSLDTQLVAVPSGSETAIADQVVAIYSERTPQGPFSSLAPFGVHGLPKLRLAVDHAHGRAERAPKPVRPAPIRPAPAPPLVLTPKSAARPAAGDAPTAIAARLARLTGLGLDEVASTLYAPGPEIAVSVLAFNRLSLTVRPATSDVAALVDAFDGLFHLPPAYVRSPRLIVELGASIGATTAHYAEIFPGARIVAVERDPGRAALARTNAAQYGKRVTVVEAAVGTAGVTLDALLDETAPGETIDFLKLDVAGTERDLIAAGGAWVTRTQALKVELHGSTTVDECIRDLARLGFAAEQDPVHHAAVVARRSR